MTLISNILMTAQTTAPTQSNVATLPFLVFLTVIALGAAGAIIWELNSENANR